MPEDRVWWQCKHGNMQWSKLNIEEVLKCSALLL